MSFTVDFVPFATGAGANVTAQATWITESATTSGFSSGVASSADCNKAWRQGTFVASGVANFISNTLAINVADDGNLSNFTTNLTSAITSNATAAATSVVNNSLASFTLPFTRITGTIANAQVPQGAVTQYQGNLSIAFTQLTGTIANGQLMASPTFSGTVTAAAFNVSSDERLKKDIASIDDALGRLALVRGVSFTWKKSESRAIGVIAQDVERAIPEGVHADGPGKLLRVDPMALIGLLVQAVNDLAARVTDLEAR